MFKAASSPALLLSLILWLLWAIPCNAVEVSYRYQGQMHKVIGTRNAEGYLFMHQDGQLVRAATLDWPPYIGETLCLHGWVQQLTVALLHSQGYSIQSKFLPWARAVREVESGKSDLLYPEYWIEERAPSDVYPNTLRLAHVQLSNPFPGGNIAFMQRKSAPVRFDGDLSSLQHQIIGVVRGYQNTPEFDRLMDDGYFTVVEANNDLQMARMLLAGRVNLIIGDPQVIFYNLSQAQRPWLSTTDNLSQLEVVEPLLKHSPLYFAVSRKSELADKLLAKINHALAEFSQSGELVRLIEQTFEQCAATADNQR